MKIINLYSKINHKSKAILKVIRILKYGIVGSLFEREGSLFFLLN